MSDTVLGFIAGFMAASAIAAFLGSRMCATAAETLRSARTSLNRALAMLPTRDARGRFARRVL